MNFNVMQQCIDYALDHLKNCNLSFSFTTNLTLMTKEIADYLGKISNLSIVLSMDGPANIHNLARVYGNNSPTFDDAYRGLKYIAEAGENDNFIKVDGFIDNGKELIFVAIKFILEIGKNICQRKLFVWYHVGTTPF